MSVLATFAVVAALFAHEGNPNVVHVCLCVRSDRSDRVAEVAVDLECELQLVGASAIEDKLQEGVPEAIFNLAKSGIK